jgi:hypothetical protein
LTSGKGLQNGVGVGWVLFSKHQRIVTELSRTKTVKRGLHRLNPEW